MNEFDTLRQTLSDLADNSDTGSADLYDRALEASRRLGRRRIAVATVVMAIVAVLAAVPFALAGRDHSAPPAAPRPTLSFLATDIAADPYYMTVGPEGNVAYVLNAATGAETGVISSPDESIGAHTYKTTFEQIAGSADDRSFILVTVPDVIGHNAAPAHFLLVRLDKDGRPSPAQPLDFLHADQGSVPLDATMRDQGMTGSWQQQVGSVALAHDGTEIAVNLVRVFGDGNVSQSDLLVASLTTGQVRIWHSPGRAIGDLTWLDRNRLAYGCAGVCLLDTTGPLAALSDSTAQHLISPAAADTPYGSLRADQDLSASPDGTMIYAGTVDDARNVHALVEYSLTTGRLQRVLVMPRDTVNEPYAVLWSSPTGDHMVISCGTNGIVGTVDNGTFHAATPPPSPVTPLMIVW